MELAPRRNLITKMTPAEFSIYQAMLEIEKLPANVKLTDAVVLLSQAKDKVADFVDNVE